ncbi:glycosyltransferase [Gryllotalpicola reticulitermitis]|uniref:4,4'-diaponeurosporenoate glycosyltransferase n=1 Tax=Gryllotalpicola reticulitermitis TaxID=1184153 RepID=A0ABV8Q446_9MICO
MRSSRSAVIEAVAVVVPVRDEEDRLDRSLAAIVRALGALPGTIESHVVIALDGCTDGSARIAARWPVGVLTLDSVGVGRARASGVDAALGVLGRARSERVWLANTDGDSEVPENWLTAQLEFADDGWDVVLGTVAPDERDLPAQLRGTPLAHAATSGAPVYGANIGVRASRYLAVGGFPAVREHEDARLVEALRSDGARVTSAYDIPVLTSGRPIGRSPGGYAGFLRDAAQRASLPILS